LGHSSPGGAGQLGEYYAEERFIDFIVSSLDCHEQVLEINKKFGSGDFQGGFSALSTLMRSYAMEARKHVEHMMRFQSHMMNSGIEKLAERFQ